MKEFADFVANDAQGPAWDLALVEIIVSQVLARAGYNQTRFQSISDIRVAINNLDGYPVTNTFDDGTTVIDVAARRITWMIGLLPD